jgi:ATP-binding cassette subfamily C (CFTR/MRP) protein 1
MTGGQVRSSLMSIIFDKAMTISSRAKAGGQSLVSLPPSIEPGSEAEKKFLEDQLAKAQGKEQRASGWSNGRIVNLMSTDTYRIDQTCGYFHMVWTSPLSMLITVALLLINLQYSAVVGIVFFFGAVPILGLAARQLMRSRRAINKLTDKRVVITQEVMQAIRFVKYYAWEADFTKRLRAVRKQEIRGIRVLLGIRNLVNVMGTSIPIFASMLTFITYSLSKHPLNPAPVFSSLALFNALRAPLIVLPLIMGLITDALQSIARIEEYLLAEDGMDLIEKETGSKFALELLDASFTWEQNTPDVSAAPSKKEIKQMEKAKKPAKDVKVEAAVSSSPVNSGTLDDPTSSNLVESLSLEARPFALEHINLQVRPSELIAVVGEVGSGKSSLLCAIAGEMRQTSGRVVANGNRALCPQLAWIQNTSLRDNITFGLDFDKTKYDQITEACSLTHDLQVLPNGSLTEIGERGINLSGGQKHRVSLARAVYFDADIILLDDPLAAVDAHVGTHIMDQAICTLLKDKCRILATHQLQVLQRCDRIVVMESGKIIACDTFPHLMAENEKFKEMMATVDKQTAEKPEMEVNVEEVALKKQLTTAKTQVALIQEEDRQVNSISMAVWNDYFRSTGSLLIPPIVLLMLILGQGANIVTSLWLAWWSSNKLHYNTGTYVSAVLCVLRRIHSNTK